MFRMALCLAALWFGGRLGWELGSDHGPILGLLGVVVGAGVVSTLVRVAAGLFGYKPGRFERIEHGCVFQRS